MIVDMKQYIDKLLSEAPPDIKGVAQTPAGEHLFKVNPECKCLDTPSAMMFYQLFTCLLFLTKQACPDILMAVAFLTTCIVETIIRQDNKRAMLLAENGNQLSSQ